MVKTRLVNSPILTSWRVTSAFWRCQNAAETHTRCFHFLRTSFMLILDRDMGLFPAASSSSCRVQSFELIAATIAVFPSGDSISLHTTLHPLHQAAMLVFIVVFRTIGIEVEKASNGDLWTICKSGPSPFWLFTMWPHNYHNWIYILTNQLPNFQVNISDSSYLQNNPPPLDSSQFPPKLLKCAN